MSRCPPPRPRPPRPASATGYPPGPGTAGRIWPRSPSDSAGGSPTSTVSCPTERSCGCAGCATPVTPARGGLRSTAPATTTTKTASCPADPPQAAPKKPSTARVGSTSTTLLPGRPIHHRRTSRASSHPDPACLGGAGPRVELRPAGLDRDRQAGRVYEPLEAVGGQLAARPTGARDD